MVWIWKESLSLFFLAPLHAKSHMHKAQSEFQKLNLNQNLQSMMKIHLWKLNSYISKAWISYTTFKAAKIKFMFLFFFFSLVLKIWIKMEMSPGQMDLNILFNDVWDNLMNKILMQKSMRMSNAGEEFSYFMTSFKKSKTVLNLPSYLSIFPE